MKCGVWSVLLCLCLSVSMSVSMSVSVCEGGCSWLREVTRRHGSNVLPFSGPSVGYCISLPGSLGNGRFGPNPSREVTGANFCHLAAPRFGPNPGREVIGGYGKLRAVMGGYGGGKRRKVEERQEKGTRKPQKMTEMSSVTE